MRQERQREVVRLQVAGGPEQSSFLDWNYKPGRGRCPGGQGSPGPSGPGRPSVIRHGGPLGRALPAPPGLWLRRGHLWAGRGLITAAALLASL